MGDWSERGVEDGEREETDVGAEGASGLRHRDLSTASLMRGIADEEDGDEDVGPLARKAAASHRKNAHAASHVHHMTEAELKVMASYESLDYDTPCNELYRKERMHMDQRVNSRVNIARWTIFALIGMLTGSLAFCLSKGVDVLSELKFGAIRDRVANGELAAPFFIFFFISTGYVLIATYLVAVIEPVAGGSGIPEIKAYLNGTNYLRFLRLKTLLVKAVGVIFSVSGGLAIGKEGPLVHSGAVFAANLSHWTYCGSRARGWLRQWVYRFRNDRDKRDFVSGGAAAGVAAAFGSPVGGILFSLEEASSWWSIDLTWRVFLCSMLGTFFLNVWKLALNHKSSFEGLISFGPAINQVPYRLWETPLFFLLACFGGLIGALFNHINSMICRWRRDVLRGKPIPRMIEALVIAAITAICIFWAPLFFTKCDVIPDSDLQTMEKLGVNFFSRYQCPEGQYNSMASMLFTTTEIAIRGFFHNKAVYDPHALIVYFVIIFFLAVITYGIAVPSGLFVPCILMGCAFGRLMGEGMRFAFPDAEIVPGTYALIGATAALGGVARMTISLTVIILETTNDIQFVAPIMFVLMVSKWVGDVYGISLYDRHVELRSFPFVESAPSSNMYMLCACDIMSAPVVCLPVITNVAGILEVLKSNGHNGFPVVENKHFKGMVLRSQLITLLNKGAYGPRPLPLHYDDFATSLSSKHVKLLDEATVRDHSSEIVDLRPIMNPVPVTVQLECPLSRVFTLFRSLGVRHLVVTNDANEVAGIITRTEVSTSFDQDLF